MDEATGMVAIYTTFSTESDARKIGSELVEEKLAACVNIFPGMLSIYRWQGAVEQGTEAAMLVKTRKDLAEQVLAALAARHPYSVPALMVFEPQQVAASYLEWLCSETAAQS
jgi:periplasmic divalent cation tolerance protein